MRKITPWATGLALAVALAAFGPAPAAEAAALIPPGMAPHPGVIVREFDPPDEPWLAGHRGVDFAGNPGDPVVAAAGGTVRFAGLVAGKPVVSIDHGGVVTTYEPVAALVKAGDPVLPGDLIGTLEAGHACPAAACLHWGLKEGDTYLDPRLMLAAEEVRLVSAAAYEALAAREHQWEQWQAELAARGLAAPVAGLGAEAVTSAYGYRYHPITGEWGFHDGMDIAAACGTPVRAAAAGTITFQGDFGDYGLRVVVDNGTVRGRAVQTGYNHLSAFALSVGTPVARGQIIGYIGSTGLSTGCHLHFMVWESGRTVDPAGYL
jgi:murein DD-endopeptidase MepM/ murein hydrolase activator NlpD